MQVKDDGGSECSFVTNEIGDITLSRKAANFHQVRSYDEFIRRFLYRNHIQLASARVYKRVSELVVLD